MKNSLEIGTLKVCNVPQEFAGLTVAPDGLNRILVGLIDRFQRQMLVDLALFTFVAGDQLDLGVGTLARRIDDDEINALIAGTVQDRAKPSGRAGDNRRTIGDATPISPIGCAGLRVQIDDGARFPGGRRCNRHAQSGRGLGIATLYGRLLPESSCPSRSSLRACPPKRAPRIRSKSKR
jgi:hypothetical protein